MAKNQMMGSTVMTPAERRRIAEQQKARQKERDKIARERKQAAEFGAQMSPTASKDDKARARIRSNTKDVRFTGTKQTARVKAAGQKVADTQRAMAAAAAKRKITQAEAKTKPVTKKPAAKTSTTTTAPKKPATGKNYNVGVSKGGVSFGEAFKHFRKTGAKTFTWNGKKYTTDVAKAKPKAKISTPTPADFTATRKSKDPRGNQIKATPGKKGPLASARKEYPVTGPGSQSKILRPKKAAAKIPAGAKPFKGSYDSKKFKLQNIKGKTYVVPKGK